MKKWEGSTQPFLHTGTRAVGGSFFVAVSHPFIIYQKPTLDSHVCMWGGWLRGHQHLTGITTAFCVQTSSVFTLTIQPWNRKCQQINMFIWLGLHWEYRAGQRFLGRWKRRRKGHEGITHRRGRIKERRDLSALLPALFVPEFTA